VTPERAGTLASKVPDGVTRVGLFVDASDDAIAATLAAAPLDLLPFHGRESPERVAAAKRRFGLPGGNGLAFDWQLLAGRRWSLPWMLSGGLDAGNLAEAVRVTGAPAVDVSSGVESAPGIKDPRRIAAFLAAARALSER
jgi:phosphoribosylanthranilate isomerase